MRVALVVDNPNRDLPGLTLVAHALARHGAVCYLVPFNLAWFELPPLAPDFVLVNYLRRQNLDLVALLLRSGIKVGVFDNEGGIIPSFEYYRDLQIEEKWIRHNVDRFFTWGTKQAGWARSEGWYRPESIVVTGSPRMDFYHSPWKTASIKLSPIQNLPKDFILINVTHSLTNPKFLPRDKEVDLWVSLGHKREQVVEWQNTQAEALQLQCKMIKALCENLPQKNFVLRPHPFEKMSTYDSMIGKFSNLQVTNEGDIAGWINRASKIIHRGSTTAIEANIAGIAALTPSWIPNHAHFEIVEALSTKCQNLEELIQLANTAEKPDLDQEQQSLLSSWFYRSDGNAHIRMAQSIIESLDSSHKHNPWKSFRRTYHASFPARTRLQDSLSAILGKPKINPASAVENWDGSDKKFDVLNVKRILNALQHCQNEPQNIKLSSCKESSEYRFKNPWGRSIALGK